MAATFGALGAFLMFLGVGAGAFGAHALAPLFDRLPDLQSTYATAVRYHVYHALGLLFVAWAVERWPGPLPTAAGYLMVGGVVVFSGSLYLLVATQQRWLGAITPIGGVMFLAAWLCLLIAVWRG